VKTLTFFTGDRGVGEGSWFWIGDRLILVSVFWPSWKEADPSPDHEHWGCFDLLRVLRNNIQGIEKWLHGETRAWFWRYWLWIWGAQPACFHFCWTVSQHFLITWSSGIDVFFFTSAIQCRKRWNGIKTWLKIYLYKCVKSILGQYALRPCVNFSCDYEIVFNDS